VDSTTVVRHLDDDGNRRRELCKRFRDSLFIQASAAVSPGGHPQLDVEIPRQLPERLDLLERRTLEVETLNDDAGRIEVCILLQEVDRVTQLRNSEGLSGISMDDARSMKISS
jgi:hypothetical protein